MTSDHKTTANNDEVRIHQEIIGWCLLPAALVLRGYVLQAMWEWFITPQFSLAAPSMLVCVGLLLTIGMFTPSASRREKRTMLELVLLGSGGTLIVFGIGWIVHVLAVL